jgi:hypothetical protein
MHKADERIVFVGPTLNRAEAESILPARYLPPARQSDILSVVSKFDPKVICLIDGEFGQSLSVWHKEILFALEKGVQVFGASSMGALRAAETWKFGMIGVGRIFEQYRDSLLTDDDDVALTYAPAEMGFINITLPLVNIQATLEGGMACGRITNVLARKVEETSKRLHFSARDIPTICVRGKLSALEATIVEALFAENYVDQKKIDAISLLQKVGQFDPTAMIISVELNRSKCFLTQFQQDRWSYVNDGQVTQRQVCKHVALHHPDFETLRTKALWRALLVQFSNICGVEPTEDDVNKERDLFWRGLRVVSSQQRATWAQDNDFPLEAIDQRLREEAAIGKLERWLVTKQGGAEITEFVLDEIKASGEFPNWAQSCIDKMSLAMTRNTLATSESNEPNLTELVRSHHIQTKWKIPADIHEWIERSGFSDSDELRRELVFCKRFRDSIKVLKEEVVHNW